jgi:hypothetical protein
VACDITTGELAGITDVLSHQPPPLLRNETEVSYAAAPSYVDR